MSGVEGRRYCGARRKYDGAPCEQAAMRGSLRCRVHGGSTRHARAKAQLRVTAAATVEQARKYGAPRNIHPIDALAEELHRTQGHVDWIEQQLANHMDPGWLSAYHAERAHLTRLSTQTVNSDVEYQRTVLQDDGIDRLDAAIKGILTELGHNPDKESIRDIVARHLRESGQYRDGHDLDDQSVSAGAKHGSQNRPDAIMDVVDDDDIIDGEVVSDDPIPQPVDF